MTLKQGVAPAVLCLVVSLSVTAYDENCMIELAVPTRLEAGSLEAIVAHRFYRQPGPDFPDNFINTADVKLGLRYVPLAKVEAGTSYDFRNKEYNFNAGYSFFLPRQYLRTQVLAVFYGAKRDFSDTWDHSFFGQLNVQSEPLAGRILPIVDLGFDGLTKRFGIGTGIDLVVRDNIDILGEYYPVLGKRDTSFSGKKATDCFAAAIKFTTSGHQFVLSVANNYEFGMRRHLRGSLNNTLYYGFSIRRLFSL